MSSSTVPPTRLAFEAASDAMLLLDGQDRVVEANPRALDLYGYARAELIGLSWMALGSPDPWPLDETERFETTHRRSDGTTMPVEIATRTVEQDGARMRSVTVRTAIGHVSDA